MSSPLLLGLWQANSKDRSFLYLAAGAFILCHVCLAHADSYFNPAFLAQDAASVADLSIFEKGSQLAPGTYRVDVWRNDEFIATQDVMFQAAQAAEDTSGDEPLIPCLDVDWLKRLGLNLAAYPELSGYRPGQCVPLKKIIADATVRFDQANLRLDISFPQAAMLNKARGFVPPEQWDNGITAGLLNYNFSGGQGSNGDSYYLNLQSGLNVGPWRLRSNGAWTYDSSDGKTTQKWQNIGTYVERALIPLKSQLLLGDSNTGGNIFDSVGFRGARLYSSDDMYPDSLRGFAPSVRGIARTHAKVVVRQNGYVVYQTFVAPGAFVISDLNPTSASGDLDVTIEEKDGGNQHYTIPYSSVPLLQREGRLTYDLVTGTYRSGNTEQSNLYFAQGSVLKGISSNLTLYGGFQYADRYKALLLGVGRNLGDWGAISLDVTQAQAALANGNQSDGQSVRFTYAKSLNPYGTNFNLVGYRYSTKGFYTLNDVAYDTMQGIQYKRPSARDDRDTEPVVTDYHNLYNAKKGNFQASISQSLGGYGSLYLSGSQQSYWNNSKDEVSYQIGYSASWRGISYGLSTSWSSNAYSSRTTRITTANITFPFSLFTGRTASERALDRLYAMTSVNTDHSGNTNWQNGLSGTLLKDNNLTYSVNQGNSSRGGSSGGATMDWRSAYGQWGVGYNYTDNYHQLTWQAAGGVLAHADGLTFGQPLGDTNVLIKAPGVAGAKVENQTGVSTDWRGYAVVPSVMTYRHNRVALDTDTLDSHTDIKNNVADVVPTRGAVVRVAYDARIGVRALITLKREGGTIPFASTVTETSTQVSSMTDDSGEVYLTGLPMKGTLIARWGGSNGGQCVADYQLPEDGLKQDVVIASTKCL